MSAIMTRAARYAPLEKQVGKARVTLYQQCHDFTLPELDYDLPIEVFVVEVDISDGAWETRAVYHDYESALNRFNYEVEHLAVMVAKRAMRILA